MIEPTTTDADALDVVAAGLGELARRDFVLAPFTTFRIGGPAAIFVRARTFADLHVCSDALTAADFAVPVLVLGQGSNLLIGDDGFAGLVILLADQFAGIDIDSTTLWAGAGVKLPVLARRSVQAGLGGLEWAVGVPGSVGGAVRMNAGGHGADMSRNLAGVRVHHLRAANPEERETTWPVADLALAYRSSAIGPDHVVMVARFELTERDRADGEAELASIVRWRREHQPGGANCGSVFTNPPDDSAGRIIDAAGLKGLRIGTAEVSEKHANFVQADENARATDVWALINEVRRRVFEQFGVVLHPEVRTAGFSAELAAFESNPAGTPAAGPGVQI